MQTITYKKQHKNSTMG